MSLRRRILIGVLSSLAVVMVWLMDEPQHKTTATSPDPIASAQP